MNKLISGAALASLAFSAHAIEYRASGSPEIVQMHLEGSWEKLCETFNNDCDVPAGRYQVSVLDRNWNRVSQVSGVIISADSGQPDASVDSQAPAGQTPSLSAGAEIVQYHDTSTWEKVCETTNVTSLSDCTLPAGTYQVTALDRNWNTLDRSISVIATALSTPLNDEPAQSPQPTQPEPAAPAPPVSVTGDFNGNSIADVFESTTNDADGDLIADSYDVDLIAGRDSNSNGINDQFEGQLDPEADGDNDGLVDFYAAGVQQDDVPEKTPEATPVTVPLKPAGNDVIFIADYEFGDVNSGVEGLQAFRPPANDSIKVSSSISRSGNYSINHKIKKNNNYISAGAWRAESNTISLRKSRYDQGDKVRYQFSIFLPPSWKVDDKDSIDAIWQWKRFSSRPDMFVLIRGGDIELRALRSSRSTVLKNYRVGEWIDLQFDVVHSARSNGSVKMYYKYADESKYKLTNEYKGATMLRDGPIDSTYLKWGLYKPDYDLSSYPNGERSIFHDDIRMIKLP